MVDASKITVEVLIDADIGNAWKAFISPDSVTKWNFASDTWVCPKAGNDFREGGAFNYRMESRDGKAGFDFYGEYTSILEHRRIEYRLGDGREVLIEFEDRHGKTRVVERFDPESANSLELQKSGWQAILDNYKNYVEGIAKS